LAHTELPNKKPTLTAWAVAPLGKLLRKEKDGVGVPYTRGIFQGGLW
jgi:hypothetical protein